jgi:hypothetical protein
MDTWIWASLLFLPPLVSIQTVSRIEESFQKSMTFTTSGFAATTLDQKVYGFGVLVEKLPSRSDYQFSKRGAVAFCLIKERMDEEHGIHIDEKHELGRC